MLFFLFSIHSTNVASVEGLLNPCHYFSCWRYNSKQNPQSSLGPDEASSLVGKQSYRHSYILYTQNHIKRGTGLTFNMLSPLILSQPQELGAMIALNFHIGKEVEYLPQGHSDRPPLISGTSVLQWGGHICMYHVPKPCSPLFEDDGREFCE